MIAALCPARPCAQERAIPCIVCTLSDKQDLYNPFTISRLGLVRNIVNEYDGRTQYWNDNIRSALGTKVENGTDGDSEELSSCQRNR